MQTEIVDKIKKKKTCIKYLKDFIAFKNVGLYFAHKKQSLLKDHLAIYIGVVWWFL